jgi:hypothetical protein
MQDPQSLHKYLYVHGDPVNGIDPTGEFLAGLISVTIGNFGRIKDAGAATAGRFTLELAIHAFAGASLGIAVQNIYGGFSWKNAGTGAYYGSLLGAGFYIAQKRGGGKLSEAVASGIITGAINAAIGVVGDLHEFANDHIVPEAFRLRLHPNHAPARLIDWSDHESFSTSTVGSAGQAFFQGFAVGMWNEATEVFSGGVEELGDAALNFVDTYLNVVFAALSTGQPIDHGSAVSLGLVASATDLVQAFIPDDIPGPVQQLVAGAIVGAGLEFLDASAEAGFGINLFDSDTRFA